MYLDKVSFYTGQIIDNYIYASQAFFNGLIKIDINTNKAILVDRFPNEIMMTPVLHRFSWLYNNKIFFIPCAADNVAVYDGNNDTIISIPINRYNNGDNVKSFFVNENYLWIIPVSGKGKVIIINMDNYEVEVRDIKDYPFGGSTVVKICQENKWVYFAENGSQCIIKYNVETGEVSRMKSSKGDVYVLSKGRDGLWVIGEKNESLEFFDGEKETSYPIAGKNEFGLFVNVIDFKQGVYAIPYGFERFLKKENNKDFFTEVDISSLNIKKINEYQGTFSFDLIETNDYYYLPPYNVDKMITINKESGVIGARKIVFDEPDSISAKDINCLISGKIINEGIPLYLKSFIEVV